jgi:hypothetical protein
LELIRSVYEYPLGALLHVPEVSSVSRNCYQTVVFRLIASVSSRFESSAVLFTDGSKSEAGTGFGVYQLNGGDISFRLREPRGVFTSELLTINFFVGQHELFEGIADSKNLS